MHDDLHVAGIDAGEVDDDPQLVRLLRAHDVDARPEAEALDTEAGAVPELVDEVPELLECSRFISSEGTADSLASAARPQWSGQCLVQSEGEVHRVHGLEHLAAHSRREEVAEREGADGDHGGAPCDRHSAASLPSRASVVRSIA